MSKVRLTKVCNITTGKLDANAAEENGRFPYFTCAPEPLSINTYAFDEDAILLAGNNAAGNFHCQRYNGKFNAYQRTYVITAREGYDIEYIFYCLKINLELLRKKAQGSQTKFLTMQLLDAFEIDDIPLIEQKRIAYTLSDIDSKIKNNNAINAELESMARTIYDYWFLQFDFPDENGKPYKSSGGKMVWNEDLKREIPDRWEVLKLDKLCDFSNGINYDKNQEGNRNYKIVNVRNITASTLLLDSSDFDDINLLSTQANKYIIEKNDILIARSGTPGAVRLLLSDEEDIIYCGFIIKCSPKNINQRLFLTYALKKLEGSNATTTGGSIMQNVSQETLKQVNICLPSDEIIEKYNKVVTPLLNKMQQIICENQELTSLRDFLLPLLMNGQVGFKN